MEVLVRMHTCILWRSPAGRVNTRRNLGRVILAPPLHKQGNCILRLGNAAQRRRSTLGRGGCHPYGLVVGHHALADIDVVRVEVVGDIGVAARPGLERLQLALGLAHVAVEVVEVAHGAGLEAGVGIGRVEALVVLDEDEDTGFAGRLDQGEVVGQLLGGRLGD